MKRIFAVAEYIFKQSFRNKILNVLIVFAVFAIGFSLVISELSQESELKMINDFGLFSIAIFSFLTLALSITVQMFEETELKTLLVVMVKPIKRHEYIIGKYIGIMAIVFMNVIFMLVTLMAIIKVKGGDPWDLHLILAASGSFISIAVITSIALLLSVVTTSVPSCIILLFFVYVLGHLMIHLKNLADKAGNAAVKLTVDILYYIVPNLELFNLKDKIYSYGPLFSLRYFGLVSGYAALYVLLAITLTSYIFNKKEFF
jgi:ABC-type transport system involved in multi-copper enzyme maturation permease subunit